MHQRGDRTSGYVGTGAHRQRREAVIACLNIPALFVNHQSGVAHVFEQRNKICVGIAHKFSEGEGVFL
jgi:hypothetical protein